MSTKNGQDIPGNAMGSAALHQRMLMASGRKLQQLEHSLENVMDEGVRINRITFKCGGDVRGSWLAIVTAVTAEGPIVTFHSAEGIVSTIEGLSNKLRNGSLKWKEDEYAK